MHQKREFVHKEVLKIFPWIKARTLISWSERGLIKPEFEEASGRGTRRRYSYQNLIEIGVVSELLDYGIPFNMISTFIHAQEGLSEELRDKGFDMVFLVNSVSGIAIDYEGRSTHAGDAIGHYAYQTAIRTIEEFAEMGGKEILGMVGRKHLGGVTIEGGKLRVVRPSYIVINIQAIKEMVDMQIKEFGE
jgi:DNA-binding transcriptional MerR regulator